MQRAATTEIDGVQRRVVTSEAWHRALEAMLGKEKAHVRAGDELAAERRRMPWLRMGSEHSFRGVDGPARLPDLFRGRKQLALYHFMFGPQVDGWPDAGCPGCSFFTDQIGHLDHMHARGLEVALASAAPLELLQRYRERMGWAVPWYETTETFQRACDVSPEGHHSFGLSILYRAGDDVYRTYFVARRGIESLGTAWSFLDLAPLGRQESWQDAPEGTPQGEPYVWWRRHGEYGDLDASREE